MRVAVIGSGLAGLTTAYLLDREGAEVWLLEKSDKIGFHSASVVFDARSSGVKHGGTPQENGDQAPGLVGGDLDSQRLSPSSIKPTQSTNARVTDCDVIDVPMRSFQGGYYPLLIALYRHLGLTLLDHVYTFSFSYLSSPYDTRLDIKTYLTYEGASGRSFPTLPYWSTPLDLFHSVKEFFIAASCYVIFLVLAIISWHGWFPRVSDGTMTLGEFVAIVDEFLTHPIFWIPALTTPFGGWFPHFAKALLIPLFSAVGTMTADDVWTTPARTVLDYVYLTIGTSHYVLGSASASTVAQRLIAPLKAKYDNRVRLSTMIQSLRYKNKGTGEKSITIVMTTDNGEGEVIESEIEVDKVVIATQPRAAATLLGTLEPSLVIAGDKREARRVSRMRKALGEVESRETIVVTHTDTSVLPQKPDRRAINLLQPRLPIETFTHSAPSQDSHSSSFSQRSSSSSRSSSPPPLSPSTSTTTSPSRPHTPLATASAKVRNIPFFPPREGAVYTMATHVARTQPTLILQTTNPVVPISPASVLSVTRMERALPLRKPMTLNHIHPPRTGDHSPLVYLAGSYAYPGIPLLEGCVGSARRVVSEIMEMCEKPSVTSSTGTTSDKKKPDLTSSASKRASQRQRLMRIGKIDWANGKRGLIMRIWTWRWSEPQLEPTM